MTYGTKTQDSGEIAQMVHTPMYDVMFFCNGIRTEDRDRYGL